jgi:predicted MFS family arabinose efflux permease
MRWRAVDGSSGRAAIATIFFVNGFAFASWVPHIPFVQARLALGPDLLGVALLAVALGGLITMPFTGALLARWGSDRVTLGASALFCGLVALPVRAPSLGLLALSLLAFGAANGAMDVAMNAHGVAIERRLGRPILSSLHALFSIGGLTGAGGSILALSSGWTPAGHMTAAAALALALVAIAARYLDAPAEPATAGPSFVVPRGPLLVLGGMGFLVLFTEGAIADWSAVYLRNVVAADPALVGAGFAVFSLAMAIGRLMGDSLVRRWSPVTVLRAGGLLAAAGLATAVLLRDPLAAIIGFGGVGLGLSNVVPVLFSAAGRTPGIPSGTAIASMSTAGYGGFLAGPPVLGFVAQGAGLPLALGLLVIFMVTVSVGARWVDRRA